MRARTAITAAGLAAIAGLLGAGFFWEPATVALTRVEIREGRLAGALAGRTVALLSDLHFGAGGEAAAERALDLLEDLRPDMILLAGDFVEWRGRREAYDRALEFLARLSAPLGVVAVLGDADRTNSRESCAFCHEEGSGAPTTRHGVVFLRDAQLDVATETGTFRVVGIDARPRLPPSGARSRLLNDSTPAIVLSHSSDVFGEIGPGREALVVAGDTHGGQVRLPRWFWRLSRLKPDPQHLSGLFREGSKTLFVTRGVGTSRIRFRLGVRPEIALFSFAVEP